MARMPPSTVTWLPVVNEARSPSSHRARRRPRGDAERGSGYVGRRFVKNNRLNHVGHLWAVASLSG